MCALSYVYACIQNKYQFNFGVYVNSTKPSFPTSASFVLISHFLNRAYSNWNRTNSVDVVTRLLDG
jgi:hypothetical protein